MSEKNFKHKYSVSFFRQILTNCAVIIPIEEFMRSNSLKFWVQGFNIFYIALWLKLVKESNFWKNHPTTKIQLFRLKGGTLIIYTFFFKI